MSKKKKRSTPAAAPAEPVKAEHTQPEEPAVSSTARWMGALCYLSILILIPACTKWRQDEFVRFHLNQGLMVLMLATICAALGFVPVLEQVALSLTLLVDVLSLVGLITALRRRKIRTYVVSAIFRRNSVFFRPYGGMWRQALESFDVMFVQNEESKKLLATLGFDNVLVAGDTRFDRVAEIARAARRIDVIDRFKGDNRLFVAGSTWEPDEELLIRLINDNPDVKFVVAPHEMDESRIARLMAETKGGALRYTQCTPRTTYGSRQLLILDTVGILASVYGYATWSYIGGGFGVGIHNTLEAATFGLPVAFGPNYEKFKEARDLVTLGAARSVTDYEQLRTWFVPLRDNEEFLQKTSRIAKDYTTRHQGATGIIVKTIFH